MKENPETKVMLLSLKLGACLTAPTKRMVADLHDVANECNEARNVMARAFQRWHEDHPGEHWYVKDKDGNIKLSKSGKPIQQNQPLPKINDKTPETYLYHVGRDAYPGIASQTVVRCANEVYSLLSAKENWKRWFGKKERPLYRWQAIVRNQNQLSNFGGLSIPIASVDTILCYQGLLSCDRKAKSNLQKFVFRCGQSSAVIRFVLFSKQASRARGDVVCRVEVRQLSAGTRAILKRIASREYKLCDSKLVYDERGRKPCWMLRLVCQRPTIKLDLSPDTVAVLTTQDKDGKCPFIIASDTAQKPWMLGDVWMMTAERTRYETRRKVMQRRYRESPGGKRGHGRGRFYGKIRPLTWKMQGLAKRVSDNIIKDVLKFCVRHGCGKVMYKEPSLYERSKSWFAANVLTFDWTIFRSTMAHKLELYGIVLESPEKEKAVK